MAKKAKEDEKPVEVAPARRRMQFHPPTPPQEDSE
jgi:hypothetical protein